MHPTCVIPLNKRARRLSIEGDPIADAPVVGEATPASPAKGILHHLGQKTLSNKKRQSKFGGSDGGRLLAGAINEERISLLPTGGNRLEASTRLRRQSDSHRSLLD
ncbi:unnamed protein product [Heligmosomoides polygyrus]|uniref:Uncharacterized protein n=1 Tax=Heligmosomoides polygyrus TaxID=6339 RepID=A0A3P7XWG9_HELPZ|nr:unnamed protein product [Heligmosomoides polygyrus]